MATGAQFASGGGREMATLAPRGHALKDVDRHTLNPVAICNVSGVHGKMGVDNGPSVDGVWTQKTPYSSAFFPLFYTVYTHRGIYNKMGKKRVLAGVSESQKKFPAHKCRQAAEGSL
jgi:hypothetical protein